MKNNNLLILGIALIGIGLVGLCATGFAGAGWNGHMGGPGMDSMENMMGGMGMMNDMMKNRVEKTNFSSNGERIYYTATSDSGKPISASMGGMTMPFPMMSCVNCHGKDGKGGKIRTPMGSFKAHNITYDKLTKEEKTPYTDMLIKRAVTKGLDSNGKKLKSFMPRWSMADEDLNDLIDYLKTLK